MNRKLSMWLTVALAASASIAGCGSSSSNSGSSSSNSTSSSQTASTAAPANAATSPTTSSTPTTPSGVGGVQAAVAVCKSAVVRASKLAPSAKAKVEEICNKAANGDLAGARKAAKEACAEVVKVSPLPSSLAKEQALAACRLIK
jgi:hypothetical protein